MTKEFKAKKIEQITERRRRRYLANFNANYGPHTDRKAALFEKAYRRLLNIKYKLKQDGLF